MILLQVFAMIIDEIEDLEWEPLGIIHDQLIAEAEAFGGGGGGGCACACACACAGSGRAGCSQKDFYRTNLKYVKKDNKE